MEKQCKHHAVALITDITATVLYKDCNKLPGLLVNGRPAILLTLPSEYLLNQGTPQVVIWVSTLLIKNVHFLVVNIPTAGCCFRVDLNWQSLLTSAMDFFRFTTHEAHFVSALTANNFPPMYEIRLCLCI